MQSDCRTSLYCCLVQRLPNFQYSDALVLSPPTVLPEQIASTLGIEVLINSEGITNSEKSVKVNNIFDLASSCADVTAVFAGGGATVAKCCRSSI
jgi:hypothetical protein